MTAHHILAVGISLLTNFARERKLTVDDALKQNKAMADSFAPIRAKPPLNSTRPIVALAS